ncbi:histidinol-phosphate transaminase [Legionella shakespearei]|uniref:Histidinol-phosphate aminotransferase n=1 Tax=Legionella shakespearei DSM 23087 TaxID=1122169 RepID=A0A0W0YSN9_9GAMM|nr:histidinol-phosphate transaminase [Legionella shakespearei]KTD59901.1 histidinol-phosphate aminotransferase (imidazole acetol-phosphate transaminase) [Legionella shakespearei DSM 23087]
MSILNLIRPELLNSQNYVPGGESSQYRLHANELPWSPVDFDSLPLNFYPDTRLEAQLQKQLAACYGIETDQLVLTRGSDDGIDLVTRLFLNGLQDALMQFPPTFPMYAFYVRLQQAQLLQCPLDAEQNFNLTLDTIRNSWQSNCKIIMFCSPNNPTANVMDLKLIAAACEEYTDKSVIVVDEAYIEFSSSESATSLLSQYDNLVVLRTMSKARGLAGLRLGCIIAQAEVINAFKKIIAPYTIPSTTMQLAGKALSDHNWFSSVIEKIQNSRTQLINALQAMAVFKKVYSSETNFILVQTNHARELTSWFATHDIAVRDFPPTSVLHDHLRITVGDETQNQLLIDVLSSFINNVSGLNDAKNLIY